MRTWSGRATIVTEEFELHRRPPFDEEAEDRAIDWRKQWTALLGMHWILFLLISFAGFNPALGLALFSSGWVHSMVYISTFGWLECTLSRRLPITAERRLRVTRVVPARLSLAANARLQVSWHREEAIEVEREVAGLTEPSATSLPDDLLLDLDQAILHVARDTEEHVLLELQDAQSGQRVVVAVESRERVGNDEMNQLPVIERHSLQLDAPSSFFQDLTGMVEAVSALPSNSLQTLRALETD